MTLRRAVIATRTIAPCLNIAPRAAVGENRKAELDASVKRYQRELLPDDLLHSERLPALQAAAESSLDLNLDASTNYVHALDREVPTSAIEIVRGRLALRQNRTSEAVTHLSRAIELEPENLNAIYWLAMAKHSSPNDSEGDAMLTQILQRDPKNIRALASRVAYAKDRRDWHSGAQAQDDLMAATEDPPAAEFCVLGGFWFRAGNLSSSEDALKGGLERDPYSYLCHRELGEIDRVEGRFAEARSHLELVVRMYPEMDAGTYASLALVYRAQKQPHPAKDILAKGLRIFPRDPMISRLMPH